MLRSSLRGSEIIMIWVVIFAVLFYSVPVNHAVSPQIIDEYTRKIDSLSSRLLESLNNNSIKISMGEDRIHTVVTTAHKSVLTELDQLRQFIEESKIEANENNIDISICVRKSKIITQIDVEAFEDCKFLNEIELLRLEVEEIAKKSASLQEEVNLCVLKENIFGLSVQTCLDNKISEIEQELIFIEENIDTTLSNVTLYTLNCVGVTLAKVDWEIDQIAHGYANCIDEKLVE